MRPRPRPLVLAAALVGAAAPARPADAAAERAELLTVSRALTEIEAAEIAGRAADERQRRVSEAAAKPGDVVARFLALAALPKDNEAWGGFRALARQFPGTPWGHVGMARIYLAWGTLDQADGEFDSALALDPDNWVVRLLRGQARERREQFGEARADYAAVLAADPASPEAHLGMARLERRQGKVAAAYREAEAALAGFPEHYQALSLLASLALELGDQSRAAVWMGRAAAAGPRDREAQVAMARLQAELGDPRGAVVQWRAALQMKEDAPGWKALAAAARQAGDGEAELQATARLVQLEPGQTDHWRRLAELRLLGGDGDGAEQALRQVLDRAPADPGAHHSLGRLLERRGEALAAIRHYRAGGESARTDREALEKKVNLERLPRGDLQSLQRAVGRLLDRTYRERLKENAGLQGVVELRVSTDAGGAARDVEVLGDSVRDGFILACAFWNLNDASYPKGRAGRYAFKFDLRPTR